LIRQNESLKAGRMMRGFNWNNGLVGNIEIALVFSSQIIKCNDIKVDAGF
jgi:hypothetical protein